MRVKKLLFLLVGFLSLAAGTVGVVLPILPTVPFYLLTVFCFARSSERLHSWFVATGLYKKHLEPFVQKRGMTLRTKFTIMGCASLMMGIGFLLMHRVPVGRIVLAAVWVFHIFYFLFAIKTLPATGERQEAYPHCYRLKVHGMHCADCADRLTCALEKHEKIRAKVDYTTKTATVYTRTPLPDSTLSRLVSRAGYQLTAVEKTV